MITVLPATTNQINRLMLLATNWYRNMNIAQPILCFVKIDRLGGDLWSAYMYFFQPHERVTWAIEEVVEPTRNFFYRDRD